MKRTELVEYLDAYLRVGDIRDSSKNGLQVEGADEVTRVAFAVDARKAAFEEAARRGAHLVIVHHGLYWEKVEPLVGILYGRAEALIRNNMGLYAAHLPIDAHEEVGNNAELARILGLRERTRAGEYHDAMIGFGGIAPSGATMSSLAAALEQGTGHKVIRVIDTGKPPCKVACVSGGAACMASGVAEEGYDTYVTGEVAHGFVPEIEELGLNVIFAGHYASESLGVKALARHLEQEFDLETTFLEFPTSA
jgi:dinuclear metal center YbgI/SA1388 family protein